MGFAHRSINSTCQVVVGSGLLGGCGGGSTIRSGEIVHSVVIGNTANQFHCGGNLRSIHQEIDPIQSNSAGQQCIRLLYRLVDLLAQAVLLLPSFLRPLVSTFQVALLRVRSLISRLLP